MTAGHGHQAGGGGPVQGAVGEQEADRAGGPRRSCTGVSRPATWPRRGQAAVERAGRRLEALGGERRGARRLVCRAPWPPPQGCRRRRAPRGRAHPSGTATGSAAPAAAGGGHAGERLDQGRDGRAPVRCLRPRPGYQVHACGRLPAPRLLPLRWCVRPLSYRRALSFRIHGPWVGHRGGTRYSRYHDDQHVQRALGARRRERTNGAVC
jgi:hypothetical protein